MGNMCVGSDWRCQLIYDAILICQRLLTVIFHLVTLFIYAVSVLTIFASFLFYAQALWQLLWVLTNKQQPSPVQKPGPDTVALRSFFSMGVFQQFVSKAASRLLAEVCNRFILLHISALYPMQCPACMPLYTRNVVCSQMDVMVFILLCKFGYAYFHDFSSCMTVTAGGNSCLLKIFTQEKVLTSIL